MGLIEIVKGLGANNVLCESFVRKFCAKRFVRKFCAKVLGSFFLNHILNLGLGAGLGWVEGLGWLGWAGKWAVWAGGGGPGGLGWAVGWTAGLVCLGWAGLACAGRLAGWENS